MKDEGLGHRFSAGEEQTGICEPQVAVGTRDLLEPPVPKFGGFCSRS